MKKRFSNEKGVTMLTVTLTVVVLIVILSVVTFYVSNSIHMEQFQNMRADIREIESKALTYYVEKGVLPVYGIDKDHLDNRKTRYDMNGDDEFFNPNDGDVYAKVNVDLIGVVPAYNTTYYINMDSLTVYAIDTISIANKNYPRPKDDYDLIKYAPKLPAWEEECYNAPGEMFTYDDSGNITGINKEWCNKNPMPEYFYDYNNWHNMVIPTYQPNGQPITGIAKGAFTNIALNGTLKIPNTIEYVGDGVFATNSNIKYVYIDAINLSLQMFNGCNSIEEIHFGPYTHIPDADKQQQGFLYNKDSLKKVWIETTSIGKYAFAECSNIELIIFGNAIEDLPEGCFKSCSNGNSAITILTEEQVLLSEGSYWPETSAYNKGVLMWPERLKTIGALAFDGTIGLTGELDFIGETKILESVGENAFRGTGITSVRIDGKKVTYDSTSFPSTATIRN